MRIDFLAVTDKLADRINGSTWKGLLRSRVEFIGRSLGYSVCGAPERVPAESDEDANAEDASAGAGTAGSKVANGTGCGKCAVCRVFGSSTRPGIWWFRDSSWSYREPAERQRNAIDRFTGGVRDGALWPQQYLRDVAVDLFIDGTAPASDDDWVRLALLHSLRDLHDGLIAVGPEGAAGYGTAKLSRVVLDGSPTRLAALDPIPSPKKETAA